MMDHNIPSFQTPIICQHSEDCSLARTIHGPRKARHTIDRGVGAGLKPAPTNTRHLVARDQRGPVLGQSSMNPAAYIPGSLTPRGGFATFLVISSTSQRRENFNALGQWL